MDAEKRLDEVVADSSFVIAVAIVDDPKHDLCVSVFRQQRIIYLPQTTLAEVGYFLTHAGGNRLAADFLRRLSHMKYRPVPLEEQDYIRSAEILERYADSRVDFVDATVMAVAERLEIKRILTLDRRDFSIVRPKHIQHFEIYPK